MAAQETPLTDVLDELGRSGHEEAVSVGEVIDSFEHRSLGFLLTLFGLMAAMPIIGDIPGASILIGTLILIVIAQNMLGRGKLWAPERVRKREISRERFDKALDWTRPVARFVDRLLKPRLTFLSAGDWNRRLVALGAGFLALTFYPLAFVPFGVNVPAVGVTAFGLGLLASDGLLVGIGYAFLAATVYVMAAAL